MSQPAPDDWEDAVETLRRDLQVVADDDADEEDVSAAMDETWAVVDAFDERVGDVDVEAIADALPADPEAAGAGEDGLDPASIPDAFVAADPERAASLGRLLSLVDLDDATDHDVGRLWESGREDGSDDGATGGSEGAGGVEETDDSAEVAGGEKRGATGDGDASAGDGADADDHSGDAHSDGTDPTDSDSDADPDSDGDSADELRSRLADSIDEFRGRVEEARGQLVDSAGSEEGTTDEADGGSSDDDGADDGRSTSSAGTAGGGRPNRSATAFSTVPSNRHDVGGTTGFSTLPGRRGRSGSAGRRSLSSDGDGEESGDGRANGDVGGSDDEE